MHMESQDENLLHQVGGGRVTRIKDFPGEGVKDVGGFEDGRWPELQMLASERDGVRPRRIVCQVILAHISFLWVEVLALRCHGNLRECGIHRDEQAEHRRHKES